MEDKKRHPETFSGRNILKKDEEVMTKRISGESWRENFWHVNSESE
jgi:hypothetical protein